MKIPRQQAVTLSCRHSKGDNIGMFTGMWSCTVSGSIPNLHRDFAVNNHKYASEITCKISPYALLTIYTPKNAW